MVQHAKNDSTWNSRSVKLKSTKRGENEQEQANKNTAEDTSRPGREGPLLFPAAPRTVVSHLTGHSSNWPNRNIIIRIESHITGHSLKTGQMAAKQSKINRLGGEMCAQRPKNEISLLG